MSSVITLVMLLRQRNIIFALCWQIGRQLAEPCYRNSNPLLHIHIHVYLKTCLILIKFHLSIFYINYVKNDFGDVKDVTRCDKPTENDHPFKFVFN